MAYLAAHVLGLATLLLLFAATGRLLERLARHALGRPFAAAERVLAGAIIWAYVVFVLAAARVLRPLPIGLAVLAIVAANVLVRRRPEAAAGVDAAGGAGPVGISAVAWVIAVDAIALVMAALFILAASPRIGWDDDVAHLTLPRLWLEHGGFRPVTFSHYAHWPANPSMLFALAMLGQDYVLAKLVHWSMLLLLLAALGREAARRGSLNLAPVAVGLVLANEVVHYEAQYAYIDLFPAALLFAACVLYAEWRETGRRAALVACGVACGALAGAKLNGFVGAACVGLLLAARSWRRPRELGANLALLLLPTLALAMPWYVKAYLATGDPLYPMLFPWLGGIEWTSELHEKLTRYHASFGMGRSPADLVALPWRVLGPTERFGAGAVALSRTWIGVIPFALVAGWRDRGIRPFLAVGVLWVIAWAAGSQQTRLLVPALAPFALAATVAASRLLGRLAAAPRRWAAAGLLAAVSVLVVSEARPTFAAARQVATELIENASRARRRAVAPIYRVVAERTPKDARLLLVNTNHGFFLTREYVADSLFEASQVEALVLRAGSAQAVGERLRRMGITHVLVEKEDWGIPLPDYWHDFLREAMRTHGLYEDTRFMLFAVPPPRGGRGAAR
jgi:hypothetical protein